MKKISLLVAIITLASFGFYFTHDSLAKEGGKKAKATICHYSNDDNKFVQITINVNGLNGHSKHANDIIPAPEDGCHIEPGPDPTILPPPPPSF
jgi:uncharacterized protein (UPF0333 family)